MASTSRNRVKRVDLPDVLNGPESRNLPLHILFFHSDAADVEQCMKVLRMGHFKVTADIVLTPAQFAGSLKSKYYDLVLAEYPPPSRQGPQPLEILHPMDRRIPCIFLTKTIRLETVAELLTEGAADCVAIDHVGHLPIAIRRALREDDLRKERDQTEKKLLHSEARYRALVGNLTYGMCRCNIKGKLLDVNQALLTMLGYASREELMALNLANDVLCDPSKRAQLLGNSVERNGGDPLEIEWKRKNGAILNVRLSGREVRNEGEMESYEVIVEDVTQQRKLENHLRQQAAKDSLTGLSNYRHLVEVVDAEIKRSERTTREFALLFLDLDGLKQVNDRFGHVVGSQALCRVADVLCTYSRDMDTPARFGGDEFALVLPETGRVPATLVARRICYGLANDGGEPKLSVSIGVATYPKDGQKVKSLFASADAALYLMKAKPRGAETSIQKKTAQFRHKTPLGGKTRSVNQ